MLAGVGVPADNGTWHHFTVAGEPATVAWAGPPDARSGPTGVGPAPRASGLATVAVVLAGLALRAVRGGRGRRRRVAVAGGVAVCLLAPAAALAQTTTQVIEYYSTDVLGSVRAVTKQVNGQWQVVARHDFMPFGEEVAPPSPPQDRRLFTGKERDTETGMDYFGARYLRTSSGRFASIDPVLGVTASLLDPQRWNRYAYGKSNPLRFVDSDGCWARDVHYDLTRALAHAAGYSLAAASAIAAADDGTDRGPTGYLRQPLDYHFTTPERRAEMFQDFQQAGSVTSFGQWLHATQDAFIHMDGFLGPLDHQLFRRDDTAWSFGPAVETARFTYATLTDGGVMNTLNPTVVSRSVAVPYDLIAGHVRRYLRETNKSKKATILNELLDLVDRYREDHDQ